RRVFSIEGRAGARNQAVLRCASEKVRRSCQESLTAEQRGLAPTPSHGWYRRTTEWAIFERYLGEIGGGVR
ncbi:hypothetical protein AB9X41_24895, partial [Ralstonia solanacearum]|uniref:hypothetical protein n=1 Tax=Ralstonia solanacearum TaxID=305 RepID=UPI0035136D57